MCVKHWCFVKCPSQGRLHIPAFSQRCWPLPSGPTVRKDNGGNDNITDAHKAGAGRPKRSLSELITLRLLPICCCFAHSWDLWRSSYSWIIRKTEDSELENGMNHPLGRWHNEPRLIMKVLSLILKQAPAFPLNRFLIISTNIARGSVNLPCAMCSLIEDVPPSACTFILYIHIFMKWYYEAKRSRSS